MKDDDQAGIGWGRRGGGGGRWAGQAWYRSPLLVIIAINIVVFVIHFSGFGWRPVTIDGITSDVPWGATSSAWVFRNGEVWTLVTYMFVHGGPLHIALNLLMIYVAGRMVIQIAGTKHFLRLYFIAGVFGALAQMAFSPIPLVGASACAFGLLVALATMIPEQQMGMLLFFVLPIRLRMRYLAYGVVGVSMLFFLVDLLFGGEAGIPMISGVGHAAHLGGALIGWLYVRQSGLGGVRLTREDLQRQRHRNERRAKRKKKLAAAGGKKPATVVSIRDGKPVPMATAGTKDPLRAQNDEILDRMNQEGRGEPTEEERKILEENTRKLNQKSAGKKR